MPAFTAVNAFELIFGSNRLFNRNSIKLQAGRRTQDRQLVRMDEVEAGARALVDHVGIEALGAQQNHLAQQGLALGLERGKLLLQLVIAQIEPRLADQSQLAIERMKREIGDEKRGEERGNAEKRREARRREAKRGLDRPSHYGLGNPLSKQGPPSW